MMEKERMLFKQYKETGDVNIRNEIVEAHMESAQKAAAKRCQKNPALDLDDLTSEAYIGLIEAVDKFDCERDTRFASFLFTFLDLYLASNSDYVRSERRAPEFTDELPDAIDDMPNPLEEAMVTQRQEIFKDMLETAIKDAGISARDERIYRERVLQDPPTKLQTLAVQLGVAHQCVQQAQKRAELKIAKSLQNMEMKNHI